jgi:hypothetical protein
MFFDGLYRPQVKPNGVNPEAAAAAAAAAAGAVASAAEGGSSPGPTAWHTPPSSPPSSPAPAAPLLVRDVEPAVLAQRFR